MNDYERIPNRPPFQVIEVVEWTGDGRAVLQDGSVVRKQAIDFGKHWTEADTSAPAIDPAAATVIRAIEAVLAVRDDAGILPLPMLSVEDTRQLDTIQGLYL